MNDPLARLLKSLAEGGTPQIPSRPARRRAIPGIEDLLRACAEVRPDEPDHE